ncbi:unnamed protein product [Bursaphelenchus okinawaensis]|uniref:Uncharacterized protein n=1 Tax=Bursaphelenchus okinawaensis TaxID=465554 RepID=A0A811KEZ2_9BILA|nr:unnamed protein product [Bursaphelenchus okinawaensis]CAG9100829.1 unnamed protein product [Bursaphelenchus okinawaensis]
MSSENVANDGAKEAKPEETRFTLYFECKTYEEEPVLVPMSDIFVEKCFVIQKAVNLGNEKTNCVILPCEWTAFEMRLLDHMFQYIIFVAEKCHIENIDQLDQKEWNVHIFNYRARFLTGLFKTQQTLQLLPSIRKAADFYNFPAVMAYIDNVYAAHMFESVCGSQKRRNFGPVDSLQSGRILDQE